MDWEIIFKNHSADVYQYLLNLSGNLQEAEDLMQETFIRAIRSESSLRNPEKVKTWLLTISRNMFLDAVRKAARRTTASLDDMPTNDKRLASTANNPEDRAHHSDFINKLSIILAELSEAYRTAFTLGIIQKLTYREIEEITGWSLSKVKINIFRARQKVAASLQDFQR
jgi:RNA polymerase sigma-70 factor (ECF subfamily)